MTEAPDELMREATQLNRQNRIPEAMAAYQAIVARWPQSPNAWFNLAVLQRQTQHLDQALLSYQKALDAGIERPEEVHLNKSVIFGDYFLDHAAAARELQSALTLNPAYTPALLNLANLYESFGRRPEASALYARIMALDPLCHEALARFANMQQTDVIDAVLLARLKAALGAAGEPMDRASLGFALGRLLDADGKYEEAFAAYEAANRASLESAGPHVVRYDRAIQEAFVDGLIAAGTPKARASVALAPPRPIFICGMFRSGSTLTEQILATIPGVAAGGEMDFLPRYVNTELVPFFDSLAAFSSDRLDATAARYRTELLRVSANAAYVTDKRPDNFSYIGLIKRLFPDAKIVHTTRDPLDNCLSIFFLHLEQQMSYALNLMDLGHYYREYRRLMAHWKREFAADIFDLDYDALVRAPVPTLERLCEFLELEWTGQMPQITTRSSVIRTASVWQVREPLYRTSSGRAGHYRGQLQELRDYLSDMLPP